MKLEEFNILLNDLNISCDKEKYNKLLKYLDFLKEYNSHTNITAIKDDKEVFIKHFYDSLTICSVEDLTKVNNLLDVGSGAGFPGVVLKIFYPSLNVYLLDSNNKKITFLKQLIEKLNISGIYVINQRVEEYVKEKINYFDIVTARAVANLRVLSEISLPLVKKGGYMIALKGQIDETLESIGTINALGSEIIEKKQLLLPCEYGFRSIIKIKKNEDSNLKKLRPYSKIIKNKLK